MIDTMGKQKNNLNCSYPKFSFEIFNSFRYPSLIPFCCLFVALIVYFLPFKSALLIPRLFYFVLLFFFFFLKSFVLLLLSFLLSLASSLSCRLITDGTTDIHYVGLAHSLSEGYLACVADRDSGREKEGKKVWKEWGWMTEKKINFPHRSSFPLYYCFPSSFILFSPPLLPPSLSGLSFALISKADSKTEKRKTLSEMGEKEENDAGREMRDREREQRSGLFEFSIKRIHCSRPGEMEMDEKTEKQ